MNYRSSLNIQRLTGIDLFRGISAFAVVVIHVGAIMLYLGSPKSYSILIPVELSRFAVPFFLASSFYLMMNKLYMEEKQKRFAHHVHQLKSRATRLLIPYFCWSCIYFVLRVTKSVSESENSSTFIQDWVHLLFLEEHPIHLYFLPLLFTGSFLIIVAEFLAMRNTTPRALMILIVLSAFAYELQILSGNDFKLTTAFGNNCLEKINSCSVAYQSLSESLFFHINDNQVLRISLVVFSWLVRCLPYIFIAMLLKHPLIRKHIEKFSGVNLFIAIALTVTLSIAELFNKINLLPYFPTSLYELGVSSSLLVCAISLSFKLKNSWYVKSIGKCSFGIYLIHYLVLVVLANFADKFFDELINKTPIFTMLFLTFLTFSVSWLVTHILLVRTSIFPTMLGQAKQ